MVDEGRRGGVLLRIVRTHALRAGESKLDARHTPDRDMTEHARLVLADCELAAIDLQAASGTEAWTPRWVGLLALLRAVGHVLKNRDRRADPRLAEAIDAAWWRLNETKPAPAIFWGFIESERNLVLKTYDIRVRMKTTIRPGVAVLNRRTGEVSATPSEPTLHNYVLGGGPFQGKDPGMVARDAIAFWRGFLDEVDAAAGEAAQ